MAPPLSIPNRSLVWGARTYLMGTLNITPDSFSGDGLLQTTPLPEGAPGAGRGGSQALLVEKALDQAQRFLEAGADILDVGGESTRPGAQAVSAAQEIARVLPVIEALASELDALISVDTYKAEVARAALEAGAHMVNDVWALRADPDMARVVASHGARLILMHNRSSWAQAEVRDRLGGRYIGAPYDDLMEDIKRELLESVALARDAGIPEERIILDPGIGFGKTVEQNLELLDRLDEVKALGYPVLFGPSRKSFIGYTLDLPPEQRLEGTAAAVVVGIARGADIVRVHDVAFMARVVHMADAILRRNPPPG